MPRVYTPVQNDPTECTYCGNDFTPKNIRRLYCYTDECNREHRRLAMRDYVSMVKERDGASPTQATKRRNRGVDPSASWDCCICKKPLEKATRGAARPMHKSCRSSAPEWIRRDKPNLRSTRIVMMECFIDQSTA